MAPFAPTFSISVSCASVPRYETALRRSTSVTAPFDEPPFDEEDDEDEARDMGAVLSKVLRVERVLLICVKYACIL